MIKFTSRTVTISINNLRDFTVNQSFKREDWINKFGEFGIPKHAMIFTWLVDHNLLIKQQHCRYTLKRYISRDECDRLMDWYHSTLQNYHNKCCINRTIKLLKKM